MLHMRGGDLLARLLCLSRAEGVYPSIQVHPISDILVKAPTLIPTYIVHGQIEYITGQLGMNSAKFQQVQNPLVCEHYGSSANSKCSITLEFVHGPPRNLYSSVCSLKLGF